MSAAPHIPLPLEGVRILDLTNVLAGPFCTYQLALMGAEVVKVEQPVRGDLARRLGADPEAAKRGMGASFVAVNAGKQSVTLDLKHPEGKEVLKRLVAEADALVENFRPGVMDRLALGYDTLSRIKPSLVYCAISGFGREGPFAQRPACDQIIQGASGVMFTMDTESGFREAVFITASYGLGEAVVQGAGGEEQHQARAVDAERDDLPRVAVHRRPGDEQGRAKQGQRGPDQVREGVELLVGDVDAPVAAAGR